MSSIVCLLSQWKGHLHSFLILNSLYEMHCGILSNSGDSKYNTYWEIPYNAVEMYQLLHEQLVHPMHAGSRSSSSMPMQATTWISQYVLHCAAIVGQSTTPLDQQTASTTVECYHQSVHHNAFHYRLDGFAFRVYPFDGSIAPMFPRNDALQTMIGYLTSKDRLYHDKDP